MVARRSVFVREATGLTRQISAIDSLSMALSGMGLLFAFNFVVFASAFYPDANPIGIALFGFLLNLPSVGVYTLMAIAMPRTGGDYVWVSRVTNPLIGFAVNLTLTSITLAFVGAGTTEAVQWAFGEMFYDLGKIYNNQDFFKIATALQGQNMAFCVSIILIMIASAVVMASVNLTTRLVRYWTYAAFIIAAVFVAVVLHAGNSTFISNFNSLSGSNYADVIRAGQALGAYDGVPPMFSSSTLYAAAATGSLAYLGFYYPVYFAGEVKHVRRTQIISQVGGILIFALFTTIVVSVEYYGEGPAFANAIASLWAAGGPEFPYLTTPLASGLSMFWSQNPVLVTLFNLSYAATIEVFNIAIFFTVARNLFAWSFDRILPAAFAKISDRTHTPIVATLTCAIVSVIYTYVTIYQYGILAATFSYGVAGLVIGIAVVAAAAVIYPYSRCDLFEVADPMSKSRIRGIPVISVLGVLTIIASVTIVYAIVLPVIGGINFMTILLEGIIPTFMIGIILYCVSWAVRRSQGVNLELVKREIPPE